MQATIFRNLERFFEAQVVDDLLKSYEIMNSEFQKGNLSLCLTTAGLFVDHTFRALEGLCFGKTPTEIKSPSASTRKLENQTKYPDSIRFLIPRIAVSMIYEIRSKRGAVHVKGVDPQQIDALLTLNAASWIIAELLRLYHHENEAVIQEALAQLLCKRMPFIETFDDEVIVTQIFPCEIEILLLIARVEPAGLSRRDIGRQCQYQPPKVTTSLQKLKQGRLIHKSKVGIIRITGPGEALLVKSLSEKSIM